MDKFYLQWNFVNWITVVLMASVGVLAIGSITAGVQHFRAGDQ